MTIVVSDISMLDVSDGCQLQARVQSDSLESPFQLWYRFPSGFKKYLNDQNGNPFLAGLLVIAMKTGETLEVAAPVSPTLLSGTQRIQELLLSWYPSLSKVQVRAPQPYRHQQTREHRRVGLFFSMGVDSFYTLLKNNEQQSDQIISHLILIRGFDIYMEKWNNELYPTVLRNANRVARNLRKQVIPVATNIRDLSDPAVKWGPLYFGSALASIGLALDGLLEAVYVAGGMTYDVLSPWGSHPDLDPLWSTETLKFIHDGCEADRMSKIRLISRFPVALETLRVCFYNPENMYNCGKCEKCLRTMVGLHIAGSLEKCTTFPHEIDVELLRGLPKLSEGSSPEEQAIMRSSLSRYINALGNSPKDLEIKAALQDHMSS